MVRAGYGVDDNFDSMGEYLLTTWRSILSGLRQLGLALVMWKRNARMFGAEEVANFNAAGYVHTVESRRSGSRGSHTYSCKFRILRSRITVMPF